MFKGVVLVLAVAAVGVFAASVLSQRTVVGNVQGILLPESDKIELIPSPSTSAEKIVNGAKKEVIKGVRYDSSYASMAYPNGDVAADKGACTEVVIRSLKNAGHDLQKLVHEDMKRNFRLYPRKWGLRRPDSNIDHRRVPNLTVFFSRFGQSLPTSATGEAAAAWQPGDIVCWDLNGNGLTHIGILSNERSPMGLPLVLHNIGPSASQQDCLTNWRIIGHYR